MPASPYGGKAMILEDDFMWITSHAFSEMRLMVEGALNLFEDDAGVLCRLAREAQKNEAQLALNDIGTCLYEFRRQIKALQEAHYKTSTQKPDDIQEA